MNDVIINQVKLPLIEDSTENLIKKACKTLKIKTSDVASFKILKRAVDSRKKPEIFIVYNIYIKIKDICKYKKYRNANVFYDKKPVIYKLPKNIKSSNKKHVIIGFGPCGMFSAYLLALSGLNPIVIERGSDVDKRTEIVEGFWKGEKLNTSSNVQFGEGGAGTFSDGKLNTGVNDKSGRSSFILETLYKFGANEDITFDAKPHIGTDKLRICVKNLREEIKKLGGTFYFETALTDLVIEDNNIKKIVLNDDQKIEVDTLTLAIGHSARDTFKMLLDKGLLMEDKPFAVGLRIIHPQDLIDISQYGAENVGKLPAAPYKMTYKSSLGRNVYSFCMCPGGYVVNASSEEEKLAINGMSYSDRSSGYANSALVSSVNIDDYEDTSVLSGVKFQQMLEKITYEAGNGKIPAQTFADFKEGAISGELKLANGIKGEFKAANLREILPEEINLSIIEAVEYFGNSLTGFNMDEALLCAIESRTSSPVKILRDENYESNIKGVFPAGEGCGYAGGIMSAAIDGLKIAEKIMEKYNG